ncbi:MAG: GntR family transcriptional regulator [Pseudothermotoga sp.]|nr:GntR family transcriptional regulator [Pseudothermotoga sp.]
MYRRPPTVSESIVQQLKEDIIKGVYVPGERMKILDLAKRFGVSQTSVREALKVLQKSDLVTEVPHKGYFVTELSLEELMDMWKIKEELWSLAFSWFAERATNEQIKRAKECVYQFRDAYLENDVDKAFEANFALTDVILEGCGSRKLVSLLQSIEDQAKRYRYLSLEYDDNLRVSSQYFVELIRAIEKRNVRKTEQLIREYMKFSGTVLRKNYDKITSKMKESQAIQRFIKI